MGHAFGSWLLPKVSFRALINTRPLVSRRTPCPTPDQVLQVARYTANLPRPTAPLPPSRRCCCGLVSEAFQSRLFTVVITCALIDKVEKQHWFGVRVADLKCRETVMTTQFCTDNFSFTTRPLPNNRPHTHTQMHWRIEESQTKLCAHTHTHTNICKVSYGTTCYTASRTILNCILFILL